ncbi:DMT family transporter [Acetobacter persici]|uniref:DMT family transporter n=1 Tax=Acetobacter persici TaxID=1076596 RepID=UPI001BA71B2D|nr:DMT family transporter [Acetobacter persici]MBS0962974.1 DMT family transporter [Acetobacter persici]
MNMRKPLDATATSLMVGLCFCFGLQQVALKAAAQDMAPILQISLRSGLAALLVVGLMLARRERLVQISRTWKPGLAVGVLFFLEYLFTGQSLRYTSASRSVVFLYTSPIFAALILHFMEASERMAPRQWAGILLAFCGIAVAFLGHQTVAGQGADLSLLGDALALLAGASWGVTTVVIRMSSLATVPAKQTLLYQLAGACVLLFPMAVLLHQTAFTVTPILLLSLGYQVFILSFVAFLLWFWLLRHYQASRIGVLSFMTPLFGVLLGAVLLHEPVEPGFVTGALLVVAGLVLVSGAGWISQSLKKFRRPA